MVQNILLLPLWIYCSVCLSLLFFIAFIAALLCWYGKQAIKNKRDRQTEHYIQGESHNTMKRRKLLPRLVSGKTFHSFFLLFLFYFNLFIYLFLICSLFFLTFFIFFHLFSFFLTWYLFYLSLSFLFPTFGLLLIFFLSFFFLSHLISFFVSFFLISFFWITFDLFSFLWRFSLLLFIHRFPHLKLDFSGDSFCMRDLFLFNLRFQQRHHNFHHWITQWNL